MPRPVVLGTAGHIDHGKTTLVKALTGVDTDRLPEEKARGITIDLGFAELRLGDLRIGVVDVPGHEKFVRNMLAGATGIDAALLVIAADDGVMPQTREHLDILSLLGVKRGVVAVTKADMVDDDTLSLRVMEVRELLAGTTLSDVEIVPVSVPAGRGLVELRAALTAACSQADEDELGKPFRLAIDRAFVVQGHGTVVTGTVTSGDVRPDGLVEWHHEGKIETVRIRRVTTHNRAVENAGRGQRVGLNLAGVTLEQVGRGQELAAPGFLTPTRLLTVKLTALGKTLRHRLPVRLHLGTADVEATIALLDGESVPPGKSGIAQLHMREFVVAAWGQPFVLRDSSAEHTLGGGRVLQPNPARVRRRQLEAVDKIERLLTADSRVRSDAAIWLAGESGFRPENSWSTIGCAWAVQGVQLPGPRFVHEARITTAADRLLTALDRKHAEIPLATTHDPAQVFAASGFDDAAFAAVLLDKLIAEKRVVRESGRIASASFKPKLTANQRKQKDKLVAALKAAGLAPQPPAERTAELYEVAAAEGLLVKVSDELFLHTESEADLRRIVAGRLAGGVGATVAELRDALGVSRKYVVPFVEFLDRVGFTKREGDLRVLASPPPTP